VPRLDQPRRRNRRTLRWPVGEHRYSVRSRSARPRALRAFFRHCKPKMNTLMNPLLDFAGLPRFDLIFPQHVGPAIDALIGESRATVERVVADPRPAHWDNVVEPLADSLDRLDRAWSAVRHLNAVVSTPEMRDAYNGNLTKVTAFYTDIGADVR